MTSKLKLNKKSFPTWLHFLIIVSLVLGIFFRFYNLDQKVYWRDEATTSLRISGYTWTEFIQQMYDGREIRVQDVQKYLHPNPEKGLTDTIKSLAIEDSQHPPLYYLIARFWVQCFGSSVAAIRSLSALTSLLVFPCFYWLCLELFESPIVGWVTIALTSVSLFQVMYAQEAREYILWSVTILLSSAALLRAMRSSKSRLDWGIYAMTLSIGLYTFPLTGLVAIGHGIYVLAIEGFRLSQKFFYYILFLILGIIPFIPWLLLVIYNKSNVENTTSWLNQKIPLSQLVSCWIEIVDQSLVVLFVWNQKESLAILILVLYSTYYIILNSSKRVYLFVLILTILPITSLILQDLILGGIRSCVHRYLFPSSLGILLVVSYLLTNKITSLSIKIWQRKLWQIIMVALIIVGIWNNAKYARSESEQVALKDYSPNLSVAKIINQAQKPLVLSDESSTDHIGDLLSLTYYLIDSKVKLQLAVKPNKPKIANGFSDVFLYRPSEILRRSLEQYQNSKSVVIYKNELLKLSKKE